MKLFKKYYNQDAGPGAGSDGNGEPAAAIIDAPASAAQKETPLPSYDIDSLKELKDFGDEPTEPAAAEGSEEEKKQKAPEIPKKENNEFELDLEDTPASTDASAKEEEVQSTWTDVAKVVGLGEIKEESFEAFKENFSAKLLSERETGRKEGQSITMEKWTDQQKELFDFLAVEGNTIDSFINPLSVYDKYLSLDDKALLREDYKLRGYEDHKIDDLMEELEVDNKIGNRAYELRKTLENGKIAKQQELISSAREKIEFKNNQTREREQKEYDSFKTSLHATKDFMGIPISERSFNVIEAKFKDGVYRTRLAEDPKLAAEVALFIEFGAKARDLLGNDLKNEGRMQVLKHVQNIGLPNSGAGRVLGQGDELKGFDAWEQKLKEEQNAPKK